MKRKKEIFQQYQTAINDVDGLYIADVPDNASNNHWMNILRIDSTVYREDRETLMMRLEKKGIQSRPVWALNHKQNPYFDCQTYQIDRAMNLVENSLCLPSSSQLNSKEINQIIQHIHS